MISFEQKPARCGYEYLCIDLTKFKASQLPRRSLVELVLRASLRYGGLPALKWSSIRHGF
ncbi:MAG: hypothetical protein E5V18_19290 [Mesorhizobium sp.]|nr:MAG: hypothetical protein E5V18_19290 [Mesorhizobium sp.]